MVTEYVIWGIPKGSKHEVPLITEITDKKLLDKKYLPFCERMGATALRVQVIDGTLPDFAATVNV